MADKGKKKSTILFDEKGKQQDGYLIDGKAYKPDGTRVPNGWSVQTAGGVFKMGTDGQGYQSESGHNQASHQANLEDLMAKYLEETGDKYKWASDKDYDQLGADRYQPIYDEQRQSLEQERDSNIRDLQNQIAGVDTTYDRNVESQQDLTKQAIQNYSNQTLGRGLGRSTIATTGMSGIQDSGDKQVANINTDRANVLNSIRGKIQSVQEGITGKLGNLDKNKTIMGNQYGEQMEDRDFGKWLSQAQLSQGQDQMMFGMRADAMMGDTNRDLERSNYFRDLERARNEFRGDTLEGQLYNKGRGRGQDEHKEDFWMDHNLGQESYNRRFTPGTIDYRNNQSTIKQGQDQMLWERDKINFPTMDRQHGYDMARQKAGQSSRSYGGGGGYSTYNKKTGGGGSSRTSGSSGASLKGLTNLADNAKGGMNQKAYAYRDLQGANAQAVKDGYMSANSARAKNSKIYDDYRKKYGYAKSSGGGGGSTPMRETRFN